MVVLVVVVLGDMAVGRLCFLDGMVLGVVVELEIKLFFFLTWVWNVARCSHLG